MQTLLQIRELNEIVNYNEGLSIGAAVTISDVEARLKNITSICSVEQTRVIQQVLKMFHWFAGKQIRNCATLGGKLQKRIRTKVVLTTFIVSPFLSIVRKFDDGLPNIRLVASPYGKWNQTPDSFIY